MEINEEELRNVIEKSKNRKEVFKYFGLHESSNHSYKIINYYIKHYNIDISHFKAYGEGAIKHSKCQKISLHDIFCGNHPLYSTYKLKNKLLNENIFNSECSNCKLSEWNSLPIPLDLDHINGIATDHRLENLRLLCRNCHAQTDNFCGKNVKKDPNKKIRIKRSEYLDKLTSETNNKNEPFILEIMNSDINFSRSGWVTKVSKILKIQHQKVLKWMIRFMPEFYEEKCFKRKSSKNK